MKAARSGKWRDTANLSKILSACARTYANFTFTAARAAKRRPKRAHAPTTTKSDASKAGCTNTWARAGTGRERRFSSLWTAAGRRKTPFFRAFAAKSFTDADITLHFLLFDILLDGERTQAQLTEEISSRLNAFDEPLPFDESTLRKKLGEYADKGLLRKRAEGRRVLYSLPPSPDLAPLRAALEFFSETAPLGEPGAFLLDKLPSRPSPFRFKHHYVTGTPDDEILLSLFEAMRDKKRVLLHKTSRKKENECTVVPLCVGAGVQSGRRYLFAWEPAHKSFRSFRLDFILRVKALDVCENFDKLREKFNHIRPYIWGRFAGRKQQKGACTIHPEDRKGRGIHSAQAPARTARRERGTDGRKRMDLPRGSI